MMRRLAAMACALAFAAQLAACGRITRDVRVIADRPPNVIVANLILNSWDRK
jgi:hypothetical protein